LKLYAIKVFPSAEVRVVPYLAAAVADVAVCVLAAVLETPASYITESVK